jgi:hypothetical protein
MLRRLQFAVLLFAAAMPFSARAAQGAAVAEVLAVQPTRIADLVLLRGGFDAGLRQGMVCRLTRGSTSVAEILVVEVRPSASAALILSVAPKQAIRSGDFAAIKVLKT